MVDINPTSAELFIVNLMSTLVMQGIVSFSKVIFLFVTSKI